MKPSTSINVNVFFSRRGLGAAATLSLALAAGGCGGAALMPAATFLDRTLMAKASFDLQCPREQLRVVDLGDEASVARYTCWQEPCVSVGGELYRLDRHVGRQQGVSGCGRRASYTFVRDAWIGNAAPEAQPARH
jgi:hypothetical protein